MQKILLLLFLIIFAFTCNKKDKDIISLNENAFSTAIPGLYVREKPSTSANIVGLLKYNTNLVIIGYSQNEENINGVKAPWAKIKIDNANYDQTIEGWVFSGLISKDKPIANKDLINDNKKDISSIIRLLDKTIRIDLVPPGLGTLFFTGKSIIRDNRFIQIDVSVGDQESKIDEIEYVNDSVVLKIKQEIYDSKEYKVLKTNFYKCIISKQLLLDIYNDNSKVSQFKCDSLK